MIVWWCEAHEASGFVTGPGGTCWRQQYGEEGSTQPCRMVPMRLIPGNVETVDREALVAALERIDYADPEAQVIVEAARAYLALDGETP